MAQVFFGERGEYGPYEVQADEFPNAGQVVGDFLKKAGWTYEEFGLRYCQMCDAGLPSKKRRVTKTFLTVKRVEQMIDNNDVPRDIERRKVIAKLLNIPPVLLGLAQIEVTEMDGKPRMFPTILHKVAFDLDAHEQTARTFWLLHFSSTAQGAMPKILASIAELEAAERQAKGSLLRHIWKNLYSFYRLASRILCDQGVFTHAYIHANNAVRVMKHLHGESSTQENSEMLGAALYTRGFVRMEWGGRFPSPHLDQGKITEAITDFQTALPHASPQLNGLATKELSCAQSLVLTAATDRMNALRLIDKVPNIASRGNDGMDSYERVLRDGTTGGLAGWYHVGKAITLIAAGRSEKAIEELDDLEDLKGKGIPRDQTRNYAWIDIIRAQASLLRGDFFTTTERLMQALVVCKEINSVANIAIITDIYEQLLASRYKDKTDVKQLGNMLGVR